MPSSSKNKTIAGVGLGVPAAVLAIGLPFTEHWEGLRTDPYKDIIGKWTVCVGETNVEMRKYTVKECQDMFGPSWASYYAHMVKCYPTMAKAPASVQAMVTDLAYNNGAGAVCNANNFGKAMRSENWRGVCDNMKTWTNAGGKQSNGLQNRRWKSGYNSYDICVSELK